MEAHALYSVGAEWNILGDSEYAEVLKNEARTINPGVKIKTDIDLLLEQGNAEKKAGRFDTAAEAYAKAQQLWAARSDNGGHLEVLYCQAALAEARGQLEEADCLLKAIEHHPLIAPSPVATAAAIYTRLDVLGKHLSAVQLRDLQTKYDPVHSLGMPLEWDWLVYWNLVRFYSEREAWQEAAEPIARARKAAESLWQAMPTPEDRQRFAALAAEFQKRSGELLSRLGKHEAAAMVAALFTEQPEPAEGIAAKEMAELARQEREQRRHRRGLILTGINIVVCGIGIWAMPQFRPTQLPGWALAPVMLSVLFLVPTVLGSLGYQAIYFWVRRRDPKNQLSPGTMTLALAVIPWIAIGIGFPVVSVVGLLARGSLLLFAPEIGEFFIETSIWLALLAYTATLTLQCLRRSDRVARILWTLGCVACLLHVAAAFHFVHGWSHDAAIEHTARVGGFGEGIYVNHLFTLLWTADVLAWWLWPRWHAGRSRWINIALHGFMLFVIFNAAVVFVEGPARWAGVVMFAWLVGVAAVRRAVSGKQMFARG
jgi:tetratricopeptide (TPR) repeat protein